ncbi:4,5-DOPA dioxygenase extradiol [Ramlibacter sp.]|uniref:4,5-DOPA-extradiol-dioxygenase n=1 Tax=Ramlibacter sp. TaxID=1917967 RepID=UPI002D7403D6|nr:4,5-DOPA dioxygenase extradiol [Ramlibacter sp.]HYD75030.1 4,5-DOPA dioxygenase extradiol [Ramlibacter sp.]
MTTHRMPAAFIGHGSPMNTLEINRFTSAWRDMARRIPRPRAILCISAHWFIQGSALTAMDKPRVIHDFFGFPRELFEFDYPAPGSPEVASEIADVVQPAFVGLDEDSWGLDHGTWSVLAHMYPEADVPVLQLSVHSGEPLQYHFELGKRLAPLRERGIFVLGSGNVVHNLRRLDWGLDDRAWDWGERFDAEVRRILTSDPARLPSVQSHPDYGLSVPSPEHFLPLVYLAGMAHASGETLVPFAEGGTKGGITMTSYALGAGSSPHATSGERAGALPDPAVVPPEQTNL